MTVSCSLCGQSWERDPVLEVPCPVCPAEIGEQCKRPSGHPIWGGQPHSVRDRQAMKERQNYSKCTGTAHPSTALSDLPIFST